MRGAVGVLKEMRTTVSKHVQNTFDDCTCDARMHAALQYNNRQSSTTARRDYRGLQIGRASQELIRNGAIKAKLTWWEICRQYYTIAR